MNQLFRPDDILSRQEDFLSRQDENLGHYDDFLSGQNFVSRPYGILSRQGGIKLIWSRELFISSLRPLFHQTSRHGGR